MKRVTLYSIMICLVISGLLCFLYNIPFLYCKFFSFTCIILVQCVAVQSISTHHLLACYKATLSLAILELVHVNNIKITMWNIVMVCNAGMDCTHGAVGWVTE